MADDLLGTDLSAVNGLDPSLALFRGTRIVAEAAVRRITTPRGGLFYAPNYGVDVREILNAKVTQQLLNTWRSRMEAEIRKDERVDTLSSTLSFYPQSEQVRIRVEGTTGAGPFAFTLAVTSLSVDVLALG